LKSCDAKLRGRGDWITVGEYKNIHPQLADATLVYLAKRDAFDTIFTLDRRDFLVYQAGRKRGFPDYPLIDHNPTIPCQCYNPHP
jgi:hypothetical protein